MPNDEARPQQGWSHPLAGPRTTSTQKPQQGQDEEKKFNQCSRGNTPPHLLGLQHRRKNRGTKNTASLNMCIPRNREKARPLPVLRSVPFPLPAFAPNNIDVSLLLTFPDENTLTS